MPITRYKLYKPGAQVNRGVTDAYYINVTGIAKGDKNGPNIVLNEYLCHHLALGLMLPVPVGFVIDKQSESHFATLDFSLTGEDLPPADIKLLLTNQSYLASGIILFDIWILNSDRSAQNLAYDTINNKVQIFDHSHALFGFGDIKDHIRKNTNNPYIDRHCLAQEIDSLDHFKYWSTRINELPEYYIKEGIENGQVLGLPSAISEECTEFLINRRQSLLELILNNKHLFPKVPAAEWGKLN